MYQKSILILILLLVVCLPELILMLRIRNSQYDDESDCPDCWGQGEISNGKTIYKKGIPYDVFEACKYCKGAGIID